MRKILHFANRVLGRKKFKYGYLPAILFIATSGLIFEQLVFSFLLSILSWMIGLAAIF